MQPKLQLVNDVLDYHRAKARIGDASEEYLCLLKRFLAESADNRCLRLQWQADAQAMAAPGWITVDLSRTGEAAPATWLDFRTGEFDCVLCTGIEHVPDPPLLVEDLHRVTRAGGQVWVQVPLNQPYTPDMAEYWRMTPNGLRTLMSGFDEILCAVYLPHGSALRNISFFYGLKPQTGAPARGSGGTPGPSSKKEPGT